MSTLVTIFKEHWTWRDQIKKLALFELRKQTRGAVLGWAWFFIQPIMYIFCFWFAIDIGLKGGRSVPGDYPFILWLAAGIVPWFFMRSILGGGADVYHKYSHLVSKVKFPLTVVPSIHELTSFIVHLFTHIILIVVYFYCGGVLDVYLLQIPILMVMMYAFWYFFSLLTSPLSAISKDFKNFLGILGTPFFWLSGVIFNVRAVENEVIQTVLYFNPITFIVTGFRDAVCDKVWFWDDPMMLPGFAIVFVVTAIVALFVYRRTNEVLADVL